MMILQLLGLLALAYLAWNLVAMEINYRRASSLGIPVVRACIDNSNVLWMMAQPHLQPWLDRVPIDWGSFGRYCRRDWPVIDGNQSHLRYGPIWALATPRKIYIHVTDSEASHDIFQRRTDFIRPSEIYKVLEVFGPCLSTASWTNWPRHRKVLAAPFNEKVMSFVWDESVEQAGQMLDAWTAPDVDQIPGIDKDTRTLSLNVLAATGFGKSYSFRSANDPLNRSESDNYRDALRTVRDDCILLMVAPRRLLTLPFVPESWHRVAKAAVDYKQHMVRMLNEETRALNEGQAGAGGLITSFVRAMDLKQKEDAKGKASGSPPKGLSIDEIFGNHFVINFAGHDTTANTLSFAMVLLAAYPEVQDWVAEELHMSRDTKGQYTDLFPKLNRCKAIMLEALRLFPPIPTLPKRTNNQPQPLKVGERTVIIPPNIFVHPGLLSMHLHPQHWESPPIWKPSRWVTSATTLEDEQVITPQRCTYFPWSDGPQNCPGNKFSQVEFVAVVATILREHRIHAVPEPGETFEDTRVRVLSTTRDVDMHLLLKMKDADRVRLVCERA
ncbi:putative cytochrome P450 monooxygenase [Aspergillus sclerotioniger CBS 115572]|uniref:Putative cytochrome P450 monooxygenase n=1 Tax=Aspergillus sclerotioniger CBS 115572 TaxID=1450535 RepID=A0A317URT7_9EURO|nr:putative cytochrome P450 monooxygenase [Aspergillus sclerotioniger CBS 115572]PWY64733.1 putative cytochrome P450 monooxygenase [Aspergillus sclerotioniger CBS 115572]